MARMASQLNVNIIETKASPLLSISLFDRGKNALQDRVIDFGLASVGSYINEGSKLLVIIPAIGLIVAKLFPSFVFLFVDYSLSASFA